MATQHDAKVDEPRPDEIFSTGTIANIVQSLRQSDGNIKVLVEGVERAKLVSVSEEEGYFKATVKTTTFRVENGPQLDALIARVTGLFEQYVKLSQNVNYDSMVAAVRGDDPGKLADTVGANLQLSIEERQGTARNLRSHRPADTRRRNARHRDRKVERRPHHPGPREAPDGKSAERILPQRKDQSDPEGIGPRREERIRRTEEENRSRRYEQGRPGKGHGRTEASGANAPDVGRIHRFPQLPRLAARCTVEEEVQGNPRTQGGSGSPRSRSLRPRKNQGAHPRIPGRPPVGEGSQGFHPLFRRTSGRRQNLARHVDREGHRTQVRAPLPRRRA
ncbi:MAG: LON peptidase substrate-binding domain-containing protein [Acidobacteriota bacterium]